MLYVHSVVKEHIVRPKNIESPWTHKQVSAGAALPALDDLLPVQPKF